MQVLQLKRRVLGGGMATPMRAHKLAMLQCSLLLFHNVLHIRVDSSRKWRDPHDYCRNKLNALVLSRRDYRRSPTQYQQTVQPELIEIESITIETVEEIKQQNVAQQSYYQTNVEFCGDSSSSSNNNNGAEQHQGEEASSATSTSGQNVGSGEEGGRHPAARGASSSSAHYWNVHKVDPFARGRVLNYLRRMGGAGGSGGSSNNNNTNPFRTRSTPIVEEEKSNNSSSGDGENISTRTVLLYTATLHLPLPSPHSSYLAEGIGESIKDAELLAAMHAERVCDALGVPMFRLPSMQQKYAENVRRTEGRYAPLPGDPIKPEGTPVPPPLRMVSAAVAEGGGGTGGPSFATEAKGSASSSSRASVHPVVGSSAASTVGNVSSSLFSPGVAEAELVNTRKSRFVTSASSSPRKKGTIDGSSGLTSPTRESRWKKEREEAPTFQPEWLTAYRKAMVWPWSSGGNSSGSSPANGPTGGNGGGGGGGFDPTEGGCWQMTNVVSTRLSPTPDAIALPCVLDAEALQRIQDHLLQRGVGKRVEECLTVTHVAHPGSAQRMYVAELNLHFPGLVPQAMGKAQQKEIAKQLAAMHAELLLDVMGVPLFPKDEERQSRHAEAVAQFGRWAINSCTPTEEEEAEVARIRDAVAQGTIPLPLPLKQQVGGDEVWLDDQVHQSYQRSEGERIIAAQSELNYLCSDAMEVFPPEPLLEEAVTILRRWQCEVAKNPFPEAFILTKMGDFYRAATLTPVPKRFGVRGGIAIARSPSQAIALCALQAVDSLSALGIPVFLDATEQIRYLQRRRALGLPTPEAFVGLAHPRDWEPLEPPVVLEGKLEEEMRNRLTIEESLQNDSNSNSGGDGTSSGYSPMWWKYLEDALLHNYTAISNVGGVRRPALLPPYLPAYLIEGSQPRRLPHVLDTARVLQLGVVRDFEEVGKDCREEDLVAIGNEVKICVHNYLRHQYALGGCGTDPIVVTPSLSEKKKGQEKQSSSCLSSWPIPPPLVPSVCITGYGRTGHSVHNIAYLRLPIPTTRIPPSKKKRTASITETAEEERQQKKKLKRLIHLPSKTLKEVQSGEAGVGIQKEDEVADSVSDPSATNEVERAGLRDAPSESATSTSYMPLAVGVALKKKDAERACYFHAASILYHVYGEDVMAKHRAGLPRQSVISSFETLVEKCFKGLEHYRAIVTTRNQESSAAPSKAPVSSAASGGDGASDVLSAARPPPSASSPALPPPKPLIHTTMKTFIHAGKYVTSPTNKSKPRVF